VNPWLALAFFAALAGWRMLYAYHFRIDSDEPQHLHVVWAWTQGLLPYRHVFDNHTPVFQALFAPLFHALGVRADILLPMRAAMIPLYILTLLCVWKSARALFGPRAARWAVVFGALCPPFFLNSLEFRPDELWTLAWMLALTALLTGPLTVARLFTTGLLLGFAFSVSMKTSLLLAALAFAAVATLILRGRKGNAPVNWPHVSRCAGAALLGLVVVPAVVVLYFVAHGAGKQMLYCVIEHNVLPEPGRASHLLKPLTRWLVSAAVIAAIGAGIARLPQPPAIRLRIGFAFFAAAFYEITLVCFWPILTAEDYLPFFPALAITAGPALLWLCDEASRRLRFPRFAAPAVFAIAEIALISRMSPPFTDQTADKIGMVADVLKLTDPDDRVMDSKGETIYRHRPFYYVLEGLTNRRIKRGLIKDDIAARLIDTRTPIATTRRMPEMAKAFIKLNYVPVAFRLSVAGQVIRADANTGRRNCAFDLRVPQRYTIVSASGPVSGLLDGETFDGPRELTAGHHEFVQTGGPDDRLVLIWANAVERGYSPFTKLKPDQTTDQD
jgi:hypothetical protein